MTWKPICIFSLAALLIAPLAAIADSPTDERPERRDGPLTDPPAGPPAWALVPVPRVAVDDPTPEIWVQADRHNAPVFSSRNTRGGRGLIRQGTALPARLVRRNEHCAGRWLALDPNGYVCTTIGFRTSNDEPEAGAEAHPPDVASPLPYRYAQVTDRSAFRFIDRLPTARELQRVREEAELPGLAHQLDGDYFVTVADEVEHLGERWVRTAANDYVRRAAVEDVQASRLSGVLDPQGLNLPIAFVHQESTPIVNASSSQSVAPKYARFEVKEIEDEHVLSADGVWVPRDAVRVVSLTEPPADVPEGGKWIHVNLDEQTVVAYEGETPVFASLVATGKEGYDTPTGTYRIRHKYVSITMRGDDPVEGVYDVGEVPWTMYYHRSYALHGAYWHDSFGNVRSHGCTNIAPADARFLFTWTTPRLPDGWHGVREDGTWVHFTRAADDES